MEEAANAARAEASRTQENRGNQYTAKSGGASTVSGRTSTSPRGQGSTAKAKARGFVGFVAPLQRGIGKFHEQTGGFVGFVASLPGESANSQGVCGGIDHHAAASIGA